MDRGAWTAKTVKRPRQQPAHPQYANYRALLTRKRHTMPHPAQPQHTNHWAPRTRKRHQQEHRPQRPTERSDPTQHAKGRTGDCPGPRKGATTRRNVTQGGGGGGGFALCHSVMRSLCIVSLYSDCPPSLCTVVHTSLYAVPLHRYSTALLRAVSHDRCPIPLRGGWRAADGGWRAGGGGWRAIDGKRRRLEAPGVIPKGLQMTHKQPRGCVHGGPRWTVLRSASAAAVRAAKH